MAHKINGITVVSPMWGDRKVTDRMVFSVIHQFMPTDESKFKIHLVLVDDYLEKRGEHNESPYDYYLSDEFKALYNPNSIKITLIKNKEHKYQGESREIGFLAGDYSWFILLDCDDMLAPNACDRYINMIREFYANEQQKLACIYGLLYSFDTRGYEHNIPGHGIWVQSRCYNRNFIKKHGIHFPTGLHSRQGEDYPFIRMFDYALEHDPEYDAIRIAYETGQDCQATAFWFPNRGSLSRKNKHYGQHLAGWTMASSNMILDFFDKFNKKNGFINKEDERMKMDMLNMNVYAFYNLLDFLREVAATDYKPIKEDWYSLRDNVKKLRDRLLKNYWAEIVPSATEDMLYNVHHMSDVRFCESWIGTFYDYMNSGAYTSDGIDIFSMDYDAMIKYCKTLEFDGAGHEIHADYVKAWVDRHNPKDKPNKSFKKKIMTDEEFRKKVDSLDDDIKEILLADFD